MIFPPVDTAAILWNRSYQRCVCAQDWIDAELLSAMDRVIVVLQRLLGRYGADKF